MASSSRICIALAAISFAFLASCGGGEPTDLETDELSVLTEELSAVQEELSEQADTIEAAATEDLAFSSASVDPIKGTVTVYRIGGEGPAYLKGPRIEVRNALLSQIETEALNQKLEADEEALAALGVVLTTYGPDSFGGPYEIGVEGDVARAQEILLARHPELLGRANITQQMVEEAALRSDDSSPYSGGGLLRLPGGQKTCSSGFGGKSTNGAHYLSTANHCRNRNDTRIWDGGGTLLGNLNTSDSTLDVAFVRVNTTPRIFTGTSASDGSTRKVTKVAKPRAGEWICTSGALDYLRCGGKVVGQRKVRGTWQWFAAQKDKKVLGGQGDSGGPVFVPGSGNKAFARGMLTNIHSLDGNGNNVTKPCPVNATRNRACSDKVYFVDIKKVASKHKLDFLK